MYHKRSTMIQNKVCTMHMRYKLSNVSQTQYDGAQYYLLEPSIIDIKRGNK
jgi:hypothetical protein